MERAVLIVVSEFGGPVAHEAGDADRLLQLPRWIDQAQFDRVDGGRDRLERVCHDGPFKPRDEDRHRS